MDATRNGIIRPFARAGFMAAATAAGVLWLSSVPASAATVIGSASGTTACLGGLDLVQVASTGVSYAVPAGGGTITSWSSQAGADTGPAALLVWRPSAAPQSFTLVAASPMVTLTPNALNTFILATPIPVQAGDLLGLRTQGRLECVQQSTMGNQIDYWFGPLVPPGMQQTMLPDPLPLTLNVSATLGSTASSGGGSGSGGGDEQEQGDNHQGDEAGGSQDEHETTQSDTQETDDGSGGAQTAQMEND